MRTDLKKHVVAGVLVGAIAVIFCWYIDFRVVKNFQLVLAGLFWVVMAGVLKEIFWDAGFSKVTWIQKVFHVKEGTPDKTDFLYTVYGGIIPVLVIWISSLFINIIPPYQKATWSYEYLQQRIEEIHKNDHSSFNSDSLYSRTSELLKTLQDADNP